MPDTAVARSVLSLDEALDERLVGGKAAGLSRLVRLGVAVPRGIVVPAAATVRFDADRVPDDIWPGIVDAWRALDAPVVIVRSSAAGEDSADASFAGQLDSIPDVTNADDLRRAVLQCWRSRGSDRVRAYERARGHVLGGLGIIIQEQIASSMSGVLFTKDPGRSECALLEYCAGAGEDLVAGRINPGRVTVDAAGQVCHRAAATGAVLANETAAVLADEGRRIAAAFGAPQDIEWTIDGQGRIWFVQARPITAISFLPPDGGSHKSEGLPEGGSHELAREPRQILWSNANVNENFPEPITPLLYSVAAAGYYHYFLNLGRAFGLSARRLAAIDDPLHRIIGVHGARMYYNLTSIHTVLRAAPFGEQLAGAFNQFVGAEDIAPEEEGRPDWRGWRAVQALELGRIGASVIWQYLFLTRRVETFERTADEYARMTEPSALPRLGRAALRDRLRRFMEIRRHRWKNASLADAGSMVCYAALKAYLRRLLPGEEQDALHNTLLKALPGLASSRPAIELWKLSRMIRADEDLASLFATADPDAVVSGVRTTASFAPFARAFDTYLSDWGFRCSAELMLTTPSFQEDPAALVSILKSYAERDGESPEALLARQQAGRVAETRRVIGRVGSARAIPLRVLLGWTQRSIQLRERARLKQALLYSRLRRVALAIGDDLCAEGRLERRDDVFMLTFEELDALLGGNAMFPGHLADEIRERVRAHADLRAMRPPDTFVLPEGSYLEPTEARGTAINGPSSSPGVLTGTSACGGRVTARATVLADVTEAHKLHAGDVLVTRQTDPGWGPVFPLISGLVMERGGMLSHGAIIAREFGIPSIVGVADATRLIPTGTTVCLDGDRGSVRLIEERG
ncbi:MAG TPA: PEP/pyruvate-binding domain-containing protein [Vicinamibacterales bacterium]